MSLEKLLKDRAIQEIEPSEDKAGESLKLAERDLSVAKGMLEKNYDWCLAIAYNAMLQAGKALMYLKGYRATGQYKHVAVIEFVHSVFGKEITDHMITVFNRMRKKRHKVVYEEVEAVSEDEARKAIEWAEEFVKKVTDILTSKEKEGTEVNIEMKKTNNTSRISSLNVIRSFNKVISRVYTDIPIYLTISINDSSVTDDDFSLMPRFGTACYDLGKRFIKKYNRIDKDYVRNFSSTCLSDKTSTTFCLFNLGSLDQMGALSNSNETAKYGISFLCGDIPLASSKNCKYSDSGTILTNSDISLKKDEIVCSLSNPSTLDRFFTLSKNSSTMKSGVVKSIPASFNLISIDNGLPLNKAEKITLAFRTRCIHNPCLLAMPSLISSEILRNSFLFNLPLGNSFNNSLDALGFSLYDTSLNKFKENLLLNSDVNTSLRDSSTIALTLTPLNSFSYLFAISNSTFISHNYQEEYINLLQYVCSPTYAENLRYTSTSTTGVRIYVDNGFSFMPLNGMVCHEMGKSCHESGTGDFLLDGLNLSEEGGFG